MRAYKQLFFDNKRIESQPYGISGKKIIEEGTPRLLHKLTLLNYIIKEITLQMHQVTLLYEKGEYTLEIKYGGPTETILRFIQISTEIDNPDWDTIEKIARKIFTEEKEEEEE